MTDARRRTGAAAEEIVAGRLHEAHWEVLERNARTRGSIPRYSEIRLDAVGVTFDRGGGVADIEHIEGAF